MAEAGEIIATIDIGSNATRSRLFAYSVGLTPIEIDRARHPVQLGAGVFRDGRLAPADIDAAMQALKMVAHSAVAASATRVIAVATSAVREAANRQEFVNRARDEVGIEVQVVTPAEESRLAALGASSGGRHAGEAYMLDIGGGSSEVVALGPGSGHVKILWSISLPLGAVRLASQISADKIPDPAEVENLREDVEEVIRAALSGKSRGANLPAPECWALGGTPGALEQMMRSTAFTEKCGAVGMEVSGRTISRELFESLYDEIITSSREDLTENFGIDQRRAPLLLPGALILRSLLDQLGLPGFTPTDAGVCEGLAWNYARSDATAG